MNRRAFLSCATLPALAQKTLQRRPNVVLVVADDLGWGDVGMNGAGDIRTPNIDSLAREGVRFTQFYANAPECTPTRCALLTGRYQHRVGGLECAIGVNNVGRYDEAEWLQKRGELGLPASELTMAWMLKRAGYDTACCGKWHLGYEAKFGPGVHGFDYWFGIAGGNANYFTHEEIGGQHQLRMNGEPVKREGYLTDLFTAEAVAWLKKRGTKPFFLYLPYNAPHTPIQDPDEFDSSKGDAPVRDRDRRVYAKMVARMDAGIGRVLQQVEDMGASRDTMVIFISDNGGDPNGRNAPYRGRKSSLYEGGIRVPCAIRWPAGLRKAGVDVHQVAITMDLLPTILAAIGGAPPQGRRLDGINLLPVLRGEQPGRERVLFWRYKRGTALRKAVLRGDWKYIDENGREELYNLRSDPAEASNVIAGQPGVRASLRQHLGTWEAAVRAPRLSGFVLGPR